MSWRRLNTLINGLMGIQDAGFANVVAAAQTPRRSGEQWRPPGDIPPDVGEQQKVLARVFGASSK